MRLPASQSQTAETIPRPVERIARAIAISGRNSRGRNHAFVFLAFVLLGFLFTLPGSLSPGSALLGYPGDNFQSAWFLWYFARSVAHAQNPFYTRLLIYPSRVSLAWSTLDPLAGLLALPLTLTAGAVVAYNVSLILQLALAAFFARLLCLRISSNQAAAFIGGMIFGFSPFLTAQALGHLSLVTAFPIPLFALALDRIFGAQNPSWKDGVVLGVALLLAAFAHYNYVVLCLLFAFFWLLTELLLRHPSERLRFVNRVWKPLATGAATFLLGFCPLLWSMLGSPAGIPHSRQPAHVGTFSADVLGFLIPSWNQVFLGHFARRMNPAIFVAGYEGTVYIGMVVLLLAAYGFWRSGQPWANRAALLALIFYLLSLGPAPRFLGQPLGIPGPAALFYRLPFANFMSAPARFHACVALCVAILGSLGVKLLLEKASLASHRWLMVSLVAALVIADTITIPFPMSSTATPGDGYSAASVFGASNDRAQSCTLPPNLRQGTILTFPLVKAPYCLKSMWMQVSEGGSFSLVDGYLSYTPDSVWRHFWDVHILRSLFSLEGIVHAPVDIASDRRTAPATVRELNLTAIVIYDSPERGAAARYVQGVFGAQPRRMGSCSVFPIRPAQDNALKEDEMRAPGDRRPSK